MEKLLHWYSTMTEDTVTQAIDYYHVNAHFKDPFNEVQGIGGIMKIFDHMFVTTDKPRFIMIDQIVQGNQAFVTWTFEFGLKGKYYSVIGGSHLKFDEQGLIIDHRDYWDAAEELFQKLPVVGGPIRWLRRQFVVPLK
jgi:hypothetical protein